MKKNPVKTEAKIEFVNMLSNTGLEYIECGAFVSPKWVPAMADPNEVLSRIDRKKIYRTQFYLQILKDCKGL